MDNKLLTKPNVMADVRQAVAARNMTIAAFAKMVGRRPDMIPTVRTAAEPPGSKHAIGWLTLLGWLDRMGYVVEYRIVPK